MNIKTFAVLVRMWVEGGEGRREDPPPSWTQIIHFTKIYYVFILPDGMPPSAAPPNFGIPVLQGRGSVCTYRHPVCIL